MIHKAIKQLWRAKTRVEAGIALDEVQRCLGGDCGPLSPIEFSSLEALMRVKGRTLHTNNDWREGL